MVFFYPVAQNYAASADLFFRAGVLIGTIRRGSRGGIAFTKRAICRSYALRIVGLVIIQSKHLTMIILVSGWNLLNGMIHVELNLFDGLVGTHWKKLLLIGVVVLNIS